ncbi:MAG: mechanosensitive ion channel domain-containing protein [Pseudomonadota bacterium]
MTETNRLFELLPFLEPLAAWHPTLPSLVMLAALLLIAIAAHFIARSIFVRIARALSRRTTTVWDDALIDRGVIGRIVQLLPAMIVYIGLDFVPGLSDDLATLLRNITQGYMVLVLTSAITRALSVGNDMYARHAAAEQRPIKGFVQLVQLGLWLLAAILVVSVLINRSPLLLLSGFGAMTAIVLLVFRDTLLSLVASIQLTAQDLVRVGDWIEVPQFGADGDVIDIQLHTVKVQNWDKTITTIPTYALIDKSFKNWRGMSRAGARRIKRALHLDVSSIGFLEPEGVNRLHRFKLLRGYLEEKLAEIGEAGEDAPVNRRRLTNIGTFRAYVVRYLQQHPGIAQHMTLMARQLQPGPEGLPLEIYCFTNTTVWTDYEGIQSDIFDHLLAIVPEFGLKLFQKPAGTDVTRAAAAISG